MSSVTNSLIKFYHFTSETIGRRFLTGLAVALIAAGAIALAGHYQNDNWNPLEYIKEHKFGVLGAAAGLGCIGMYIILPKSIDKETMGLPDGVANPLSPSEQNAKADDPEEKKPSNFRLVYDFFAQSLTLRLLFCILAAGVAYVAVWKFAHDHEVLEHLKNHTWECAVGVGMTTAYLVFGNRILPEKPVKSPTIASRLAFKAEDLGHPS